MVELNIREVSSGERVVSLSKKENPLAELYAYHCEDYDTFFSESKRPGFAKSSLDWLRAELLKPKFQKKDAIPPSALEAPDDEEYELLMKELELLHNPKNVSENEKETGPENPEEEGDRDHSEFTKAPDGLPNQAAEATRTILAACLVYGVNIANTRPDRRSAPTVLSFITAFHVHAVITVETCPDIHSARTVVMVHTALHSNRVVTAMTLTKCPAIRESCVDSHIKPDVNVETSITSNEEFTSFVVRVVLHNSTGAFATATLHTPGARATIQELPVAAVFESFAFREAFHGDGNGNNNRFLTSIKMTARPMDHTNTAILNIVSNLHFSEG
ncbi:hypothetical protein BJ508DRAFT_335484 [Ascobolus immersus RN42]|uniref:Uncharacterized protein n=1 Tax=Ascobolus immersus RN42 TaxID=1160509 RepID=A0A3N4HIE4_ASCIM|nr:hypothetical protein BJ508DRAFT_335484 [Ascobolus immersus RN42]